MDDVPSPPPSKCSLSVVLPIFEEEESIKELVPRLIELLRSMDLDFEVIAVDDGSKDQTGGTLESFQNEYGDELTVIRHLRNRGNGASLRTGASYAQCDLVLFMDADGQHNPVEIPNLLEHIPPFDMVIGARLKGYQGSWYRNLANRFYNLFASWISRTDVVDLTSGFRVMRREALQHFLPLLPEGFSAPTTITLSFLKAGYNVAFQPVQVDRRTAGKSKINLFRDGARFVLIIMRMIMLYDPMRIFLPTCVLLGFFGVLAWIAGLLNAHRLVFPNSAIFLFTSSLLTLLLGMVSSQISNSMIRYRGDETLIVDGKAVHRS